MVSVSEYQRNMLFMPIFFDLGSNWLPGDLLEANFVKNSSHQMVLSGKFSLLAYECILCSSYDSSRQNSHQIMRRTDFLRVSFQSSKLENLGTDHWKFDGFQMNWLFFPINFVNFHPLALFLHVFTEEWKLKRWWCNWITAVLVQKLARCRA